MEADLVFDEKGETCLQFTDFQLWMNFCEYCTENRIRVVTDADTMRTVISRSAFEALPKTFRNLFLVLDAETSRKILKGKQRLARRKRGRAPTPALRPEEEKKLIETLLPLSLMPRTE